MDVDGPIYSTEDVWEFPADSPAASSLSRNAKLRRREGMSDIAELEKTPTGRYSTRRHSISTIERRSTTKSTLRNSSVDDGSPIVPRKRRIRIDDDDTDRFSNSLARPNTAIGVLSPTSSRMSHPPTTEDLDIISRIEASPKRFVVEIPIRPSRKARAKTPLQEIVVENIPTPEPNATTSPADPIKCQFTTQDVNRKDAEIVALDGVGSPDTLLPPVSQPFKAIAISPLRNKNVATILGKSPHRPIYRVGLSKRVNIEPLHGYLKKNL